MSRVVLSAIFAALAALSVNAEPPFGILEIPKASRNVRITTLSDGDRANILKVFAENVYGVRPDLSGFKAEQKVLKTEEAPEFAAIRKTVELNVMTPIGERKFKTYAYFPKKEGKVPVFVYLSFNDPQKFDRSDRHANLRWDVKDVLARGCATASFNYNDVLPDRAGVFANVTRGTNDWGAISCWALAASRVADWLETEPQADCTKLGVVGLSRLGKTALWAGATDTRFAFVAPTCSGCFGARIQSANWAGETIKQINDKFPHWFAPKCREFNGKDKDLPFGQHWLLATVAPRLLAVASAEDDWWACPPGEMLSWAISREAWGRDLKDQQRSHYFFRRGEHNIRESNWIDYLDFAKSHGW